MLKGKSIGQSVYIDGKQKAGSGSMEDRALIKCPVGIFSDGPACREGYITDASGEVYQHLEYFAFGETFVKEHSNTDRTPYLFNGKELDSLSRSMREGDWAVLLRGEVL